MPRRYDLGKRVDQKADTRRRIVEAAAELYRDRGASQTSMTEVARRADVAPGTVRNHFASQDVLARAVATHILDGLRVPQPGLFGRSQTTPERINLLARELGAFYERSEPWYRIQQLETTPIQAWTDAEAGYYRALEDLIGAALGPLAADVEAVSVVSAMLGPAVFGNLRSRGTTTSAAADLIADVLSTWLAPRERALRR